MARKLEDRDVEADDKLQAYDEKDYTETIEFPVELVDRDGVVRRYSYEESLAVYHRRIQSAPWRYSEDGLVRAEIGHCTRRIDQIKRSYRRKARKEGVSAASNPRAVLGEGYGLVRAWYAEQIRERGLYLDPEVALLVSLLQDEPACRIYHVGVQRKAGGHLLYVYPFDRRGDSDPREAYEAARAAYRNAGLVGVEVERLLFAEESGDVGYLLTGVDDLPEHLVDLCRPAHDELDAGGDTLPDPAQPWWMSSPEDEGEEPSTDFEHGLEALREDRNDEAIDAFRRSVEVNPYHRDAYLALLAVLDGAGRFQEAELYGEMAEAHLPGDALVKHRQGINLVRRGDLDRAVRSFDEASELNPALSQPRYFGAQVLIAQGRDLDGAARRLRTAVECEDAEDHVALALRRVEGLIALRRTIRVVALVGAAGLAVLLLGGQWLAGAAALAALGLGSSADRIASGVGRWVMHRAAERDTQDDEDDEA
jgi:tetratricopeptide (TPR) repeat protein